MAEILPPLIFPAATVAERRSLARLKASGKVRPIGPRLYTSIRGAKVAEVVRASWSTIVSRLFPAALLSHRTALEYHPTAAGEVYLTSATNRTVQYPGLRLRFMRGPKPLPDDPTFLALHASSRARAFLENLSTSGPAGKTLPIEAVEKRLESLLHEGGEAAVNQLRDRTREISLELGWKAEFARLDGLLGALLGTGSGKHVASEIALARVAGVPFDPPALERLQLLFGGLRGSALPNITPTVESSDHFRNKAFFESYFSNYIEGTTFELEEAEQIVFDNKVPPRRPKDAHDVVGTYRLVSDPEEMRKTPRTLEDLQVLLRSRHALMMEARPEIAPGEFKTTPNRAGDTHFVHPEYVLGTLLKGMELYTDLSPGFPRAAFIMFLIADVHPFMDGNGRMARIMMNAEIIAAGSSTIIIPTVYRQDYLLALRAMTRRNRPSPLIDMLRRAERFSSLDFSSYPKIAGELQRRNWFREPDEAKIIT